MINETNLEQPTFFLPQVAPVTDAPSGAICLRYALAGFQRAIPDDLTLPDEGTPTGDLAYRALNDLAQQVGLETEIRWLPPEHLEALLQSDTPFIVPIQPTEQPPHWVLVWNRWGVFHQVADPQGGVRWLYRNQLRQLVPQLTYTNDLQFLDIDFVANLHRRAGALDIQLHDAFFAEGEDRSFRIATCDAALRFTATLVKKAAIEPGKEAGRCFKQCYDTVIDEPQRAQEIIPPQHWTITFEGEKATVRGVMALVVPGVADDVPFSEGKQPPPQRAFERIVDQTRVWIAQEPLYWLGLLIGALIVAAAGVTVQAVLIRSLSGLGTILLTPDSRLVAVALILIFVVSVIGLRWITQNAIVNFGHRLDGRLRMGLLAVLPAVGSQYFSRFSVGDLFERMASVRSLRQLPQYLAEFALLFFEFIFTLAGLLLIDPVLALIAALRLAVAIFVTLGNRIIQVPQVYMRYHLGQLSQFLLDQLRGTTSVQAHHADATMRREYELRLTRWANSQTDVLESEIWFDSATRVIGSLLIGLIILVYALRGGDAQNWLLVVYWAINLNFIGDQLLDLVFSFWRDQEKISRYMELLAPVSEPTATAAATEAPQQGIEISLQAARIQIAESIILDDVTLKVDAGEHVAIVGASGAGKSSLAGLLLGHHKLTSGQMLLDSEPVSEAWLQQLHKTTAWISPDVQLWNDTVLDNVTYTGQRVSLQEMIDFAELRPMLERLPQGWQTPLGEAGQTLAGGEGQRVRVARAAQLPQARLVIMDEPLRGLGKATRQKLLAQLREYWSESTLIYISHDLALSRTFERVLVVDAGRIVEDGHPATLAQDTTSLYGQMVASHTKMRETVWETDNWRQWHLSDGQIHE